MSRWFRFYDSVLDDPKVQQLADHLFRGWVNMLCLASKNNGVIPSLRNISFCLRVTEEHAKSLVTALLHEGLLEERDGQLMPHNWERRQFLDKTNAERQQRFREKQKIKLRNDIVTVSNAVTNGRVTRPESDTDTDTESDNRERVRSRARGSRLPAGWKPKEHQDRTDELPKFIDYWIAQPGQKGVKTDWDATWRNWIRRAGDRAPKPTLTLAEQYALKAALLAEQEADIDDDLLMYRGQ